MENKHGYIKVDTIVRSYLADKGHDTLHKYLRFLHYALQEVKEFRLQDSWDIVTIVRRPNEVLVIPFPEDFVQLSKIGVQFGDRVMCFIPDHTISTETQKKGKPNTPYFDKIRPEGTEVYEFLNYSVHGGLTKIKGYGSGHNGIGYYTIDWKCKQFQFSSEINRKQNVYIEYITDGFKGTCETVVESYAEKRIKMGIELRESARKFGRSSREYQAVRDEHHAAIMESKVYNSDLSYEGLVNLTKISYGLSIK